MISFPNAKVNLGLNILSKRADGYHNLETCFLPVQWLDILEIIPSTDLKFTSTGIDIPGNPDHNLCLQAYELLKKDFDLPAVHVHLHKILPIGAGLGGGSADAAFTITNLNTQFELNLNADQMMEYARKLGSDCAFFIMNKVVLAKEKGDVFEDVDLNLSGKTILLIYPNLHISTAEAYSGVKPKEAEISIKEILTKPISQWRGLLKNDFEDSIFPKYKILRNIKDDLYKQGAAYASMSGSGSALFGIFEKDIDEKVFEEKFLVWKGSCSSSS